jgi:glucose/mannose-6-phosphate isomerase
MFDDTVDPHKTGTHSMTVNDIQRIDPSNMYQLVRDFPARAREVLALTSAAPVRMSIRGVQNIVLCGLGGSAIGGDLLKSYLADELRVPFQVNRNYTLPRFVGPGTLVIISSYSGNTEETITAHREAVKRKAKVLCISSGGATAKNARTRKNPLITIPGGLPPRAALPYSFFPLLTTLARLGFITSKTRDIKETLALLDTLASTYGNPETPDNQALRLAQQLSGRIGVIYSSTERFDAVATRWRGQMAENAKTLMWGHVLPEMNHNELVGWKVLRNQMQDMQVIFLRDKGDHPRIRMRMDITKSILGEYTSRITEVWSEGTSVLARMFSLTYLGDWASFYTAILNGEDPTPVAVIDFLKSELAKV